MSVQALAWVFGNQNVTGTDRLVLLALANHAGDRDGVWECWPSVSLIASEAAVHQRTAQDALTRLVASGVLERVTNGAPDPRIPAGRRPSLYRIVKSLVSDDNTRGVNDGNTRGVNDDADRGAVGTHPTGEGSLQGGVSSYRTQTVIEPSIQPSGEPSSSSSTPSPAPSREAWEISASFVQEMTELHPMVDVPAEIKRALDHPKGVRAHNKRQFVRNWLNSESQKRDYWKRTQGATDGRSRNRTRNAGPPAQADELAELR